MDEDLRIGFGYDIHPLKKGRKLFLGGVQVPFDAGLEGHSDADVLLHALCDALLGALAQADIGEHFPDGDASTKDMRSTLMVEKILEGSPCEVVNVDATIIAERPILSPHKPAIRENVARILHISRSRVSIKAKRNEGFGPVGEGNAIACFAVVLIRLQKPA